MGVQQGRTGLRVIKPPLGLVFLGPNLPSRPQNGAVGGEPRPTWGTPGAPARDPRLDSE